MDDTPSAPRIELTGPAEFKVHWTHTGQAGETHAFDISVRLGRSGGWTEECRTTTYPSDGEQQLSLEFTVSRDIPAGTVIQGRYRHRNGSSCSSGSPPLRGRMLARPRCRTMAAAGQRRPTWWSSRHPSTTVLWGRGIPFRLSATVRNRGNGSADATTLRYYRSSNATISTGDTQVGTDTVSGLAAGASGNESISLTAPSSAGTYYYGACVDSVAGEFQHRQQLLRWRPGGRVRQREAGEEVAAERASAWKETHTIPARVATFTAPEAAVLRSASKC